MSNTPITDFLVRLGLDPELMKAFAKDPTEAMRGFGVPDEALNSILKVVDGGQFQELQALVNEEHPDPISLLIRGWVMGPQEPG
jgi:hypothetical protein